MSWIVQILGVIQGGSSLGLTPETLQGLTVTGHVFGKEFECDKTVQPGVLSLVDDTHATPAELLENTVVRDGLADHEIHAMLGGTASQVNGVCSIEVTSPQGHFWERFLALAPRFLETGYRVLQMLRAGISKMPLSHESRNTRRAYKRTHVNDCRCLAGICSSRSDRLAECRSRL
jgi:hypothetical protein